MVMALIMEDMVVTILVTTEDTMMVIMMDIGEMDTMETITTDITITTGIIITMTIGLITIIPDTIVKKVEQDITVPEGDYLVCLQRKKEVLEE